MRAGQPGGNFRSVPAWFLILPLATKVCFIFSNSGFPSNSGGAPTAMAMLTRTFPWQDFDLIAYGFRPQLCLLMQDTCIQTTCGSENYRVYDFLWLLPTSLVLVGPPCYAVCASTSSPPSPLTPRLHNSLPHLYRMCPMTPLFVTLGNYFHLPMIYLENISWAPDKSLCLQCSAGILYRCLSGPFDLCCHLTVMSPFVCLSGSSVGDNGVQK